MAGEVHEPDDQLRSVRAAEGAAAQNLLLQVDFSVTPYIVQLKTLKVYLPENVSVLLASDTEAEIILHFS